MATVVYCAIKLHDAARRRVTETHVHENVYGEHVTLRFYGRDGGTDTPFAGVHVELTADQHFVNECGRPGALSAPTQRCRS